MINQADISVGTIIYIVIGIIAFIINMIQKANKEKANTSSEPRETFDDSDEWEDSYNPAPETYKKHPEPVYASQQTSTLKKEVLDTVPEYKATFGMETNLAPQFVYIEDNQDDFIKSGEIKSSEEVVPVALEFDMKKAVIYSEILNRKY